MTSGRDDAHRDTTCPISSIAKQRDRQAIVSGLLTLFGIGDLTPGSWAECGLNRDQLCMLGVGALLHGGRLPKETVCQEEVP